MTKAESIFFATKVRCRRDREAWGYEVNPDGTPVSYACVITHTDETFCHRTLNDVLKVVERNRSFDREAVKYGIIDEEEYVIRCEVLHMVEQAVKNSRKFC